MIVAGDALLTVAGADCSCDSPLSTLGGEVWAVLMSGNCSGGGGDIMHGGGSGSGGGGGGGGGACGAPHTTQSSHASAFGCEASQCFNLHQSAHLRTFRWPPHISQVWHAFELQSDSLEHQLRHLGHPPQPWHLQYMQLWGLASAAHQPSQARMLKSFEPCGVQGTATLLHTEQPLHLQKRQ